MDLGPEFATGPPSKRAKLDTHQVQDSHPLSYPTPDLPIHRSPSSKPSTAAMSAPPFQIPGLGQAKPNELLPSENFAPDLLVAAASICGVEGLGLDGTNRTPRENEEIWEDQQTKQAVLPQLGQPSTTEANQPTKAVQDAMEVDKPEPKPDLEHVEGKTVDQGLAGPDKEQDKAAITRGELEDTTMAGGTSAPGSPHVAHALEAALDGLLSVTAEPSRTAADTTNDGADGAQGENPEWEADSSPYESSSDSDSSDSSSDDDSEDEGGYQLLGLEETARLLMAEGDGDGDGTTKGGKGVGGGQVRTKNEVPDEPLPRPDVVITPEMKIEPLGFVEAIVEKTVVIKSKAPGEVQVLDIGSVLCREDRVVLGAVAETLGNVRSPLYTVGFVAEDEINQLGIQVGMEIFYPVDHAKYVFTQVLREVKGSDASNLHDEEVAADEMEFSDDEKEAEYKRQLKAKKRGNKSARGGREQAAQAHPLSNSMVPPPPNSSGSGLNYDEDEDGPYKPLARPPGFGQGVPQSLPPLPPKPESGFGQQRGAHGHRGSFRGGRGDFRGGRGRGGRGRGGGGGDRRQERGGYGGHSGYGRSSSPPKSYSSSQQPQPAQPPQNPHLPPPPYGATSHPIPPPPNTQWPAAVTPYVPPPVPYPHGQSQGQALPPAPPAQTFNFNYQAWNQNQAQAYPYAGQGHPAPPVPQPSQAGYRAPPSISSWPAVGIPPPSAPPSGAYVNPAFFGGMQQGQVPPAQAPAPTQNPYWGQGHGGYGQGSK